MGDTKIFRKFHLYAGCLFAPALIFFILSGCWQMFRLQDSRKDGSYNPPAVLKILSGVHTSARLGERPKKPSQPFKVFIAVMAFFLLLTIAVGIRLAFQSAQKQWMVWVCLLLGIFIPFLLLFG